MYIYIYIYIYTHIHILIKTDTLRKFWCRVTVNFSLVCVFLKSYLDKKNPDISSTLKEIIKQPRIQK